MDPISERTLDTLLHKVEALEHAVAELRAKQDIAEVLYRAARAVDRRDVALLQSCFHPDATDYRGVANGPAEAMRQQLARSKLDLTHHMTTNVLIEIDGDVADVESYAFGFHHVNEEDGPGRDESVRARYLDRFTRRDGAWKIARRLVVWDWTGVAPSGPTWFDVITGPGKPPLNLEYVIRGRRDGQDVSYSRELPAQLRHFEQSNNPGPRSD